ncbi:tRNA dihydrouridine synthase DusB [Geobacter sp. FeAm09]|uniref:tRNA dihydrouridine synthase DusB n=1 Tax=Geobacter sp. FeAm09 TaxID=2597769 RepID=UPI0011EC6F87|nr:tRNA dihydrouridine synthase DusB [Geobacter sp. FeAm09]QEM69381.1 tRNA dihydrouridine synthase DusB [Geobacter sp. FeAm09]
MLKPLKIGRLSLAHNVVLAPLAGITNLPFRLLCRRNGAALAFTEMVSVNGLVREGTNTLALLKSCPEDRPLGIQLFGDTPGSLAEAARMVAEYGELLDINMGCPVRKVVGTGAGSALLRDPAGIAAIVKAVRAATALPLTIKIRSGWHCGDDTYLEIGKIAEAEGCDAVTLHPRSRSQMFSGHADWSQIARLKESLAIPVIGSGDIFSADDCRAMMAETGCDGVMIARGALGNPWIFRQVLELEERGTVTPAGAAERADVIRRHLELFVRESGEAVAAREMKKHIGWYARGFAGAADIRREANSVRTVDDLFTLIERISGTPDDHHAHD